MVMFIMYQIMEETPSLQLKRAESNDSDTVRDFAMLVKGVFKIHQWCASMVAKTKFNIMLRCIN